MSNDLATEPEQYSPIVDDQGHYIDRIPTTIRHGLRCPCCPRRDHIYGNYTSFANHIKTKKHKQWLTDLNNSRANLYIENANLTELVKSQRLIIAKLENELKVRNQTVDYLTKQLTKMEAAASPPPDLLLLDI